MMRYRIRPALLVIGVALSGCLLSVGARAAGPGDDPPGAAGRVVVGETSPEAGARTKQLTFRVRHQDASAVAEALVRFFRSDIDVGKSPTDGELSISTTPAAYDDVLSALALLDRKPPPVAVEVIMVEMAMEAEEKSDPAPAGAVWDMRELAGPIEQVKARLDALSKAGRVRDVQRVEIAAVANQKASREVKEVKPVETNVTFNLRRDTFTPVVSHRPIGMSVEVTPLIASDTEVSLDLLIRDDRIRIPADPFVLATGRNGRLIAPEVARSIVRTTQRVKSGHAIIAADLRHDAKAKQVRMIVIVMATIGPVEVKE